MKVSITIDLDNAVFEDDASSEIYAILCVLRHKIHFRDIEVEPGARYPLRDSNGNRVGLFAVKS